MSQRPFPRPFPHDVIVCRLPYPWPPREPDPEPKPDDLQQPINWLTYSHYELYDMVHSGMDLETANEVAARWSRFGNALDEMSQDLRQALDQSAEGWEGAGAEEARAKMTQLASWAEEAADSSNGVSGCVSEQADLASRAREAMPEPMLMPMEASGGAGSAGGGSAGGGRVDAASAAGGTSPSSAGGGAGFAEASLVVGDPLPERERVRELHRQAAEVMERYQDQSRALYGRVPSFSSPGSVTIADREKPDKRPPEKDKREKPDDDSTTTSSAGGSGDAGRPAAGVAGALPVGAMTGGVGGVGGSPGGTGEQLAAGSRAGAGAMSSGGGAGGPAAASAAGKGGGGMVGGMPMGAGARPGGGGDETEHRTPSYLQDDEDDLWGVQAPVAPPVLGVEPMKREGR